MISEAIDGLIGVFSPKWGAQRTLWRAHASRLRAETGRHRAMEKMLGTGTGGYEAGKVNRLTHHNLGSGHENDLDRSNIDNVRLRSWNLYRNNPQARKIIRTLNAKVIGCGMGPLPQAMLDGKPFHEFRKRARAIWKEASKELDFRGKPGRGGQTLATLHKTALRAGILSGGCFLRFHYLKKRDWNAKKTLLPLQVRLIHADRLDDTKHSQDGRIFYGVELDDSNIPIAYWLKKGGIGSDTTESTRVPAEKLVYFYPEEDIDQLLGSPQFCAALLTADNRHDYEQSELTAAEQASKFVAGYRRSSGQSSLGLPNPDGDMQDLTDASGNKIEHLQAGMFIDLGQTGEFDVINMNRPNSGAEAFLNHLIRGEAVGVPGVKSSTLTGDYRNSSFSSERSADNDIWPEIEELQDWVSSSLTQPIYEEVIKTAVLIGLFDDVAGFDRAAFNADQRNYLNVNWQGPVARSINPKDDVKAAMDRVRGATSSIQKESSKVATDWRENLEEADEFIDYCKELGLPEDYWRNALGMEPEVPEPAGGDSEAKQDSKMRGNVNGHRYVGIGHG